MLKADEIFEKEERAKRLVQARKGAGFAGQKAAAEHAQVKLNNLKAHESGRNGFGIADAKKYAAAYNVSVKWLQFGIGEPGDDDGDLVMVQDVPRISWVSAGQLLEPMPVERLADYPTQPAVDLPNGQWVALQVDGDSMNKISPPGSIIFVNLRDKRLVPNACYVVADESGAATYKRYRPNEEPPFQPASFEDIAPPTFQGAVQIIGRVRRSVIEM
jgi:SOS-response transcriptional repressor LexA